MCSDRMVNLAFKKNWVIREGEWGGDMFKMYYFFRIDSEKPPMFGFEVRYFCFQFLYDQFQILVIGINQKLKNVNFWYGDLQLYK